MTIYTADIEWTLGNGEDFPKGHYSRGHTLSFDGGAVVPASASPHVVGKWAVKAAIDPEEMLVAALSDCHMLSFLHVARLAGFTVAA
jgi:organic hydroperoxide reductase OsmC/OhrA